MIIVVIKDRSGKELLIERVDCLNDLIDAMMLDDENVPAAFLNADISASCLTGPEGTQVIITVDSELVGRYE